MNVRIKKIYFSRDGDHFVIRFLMPKLPTNIPEKWIRTKKFDSVAVTLAIVFPEVEIKKLCFFEECNINLEYKKEMFIMTMSSNATFIVIKSLDEPYIQEISPVIANDYLSET